MAEQLTPEQFEASVRDLCASSVSGKEDAIPLAEAITMISNITAEQLRILSDTGQDGGKIIEIAHKLLKERRMRTESFWQTTMKKLHPGASAASRPGSCGDFLPEGKVLDSFVVIHNYQATIEKRTSQAQLNQR